MNIVRFPDPLTGVSNLHRQIDDIFDDIFNNRRWPAVGNLPAMDVYEEDGKALVAEVAAPGFSQQDIDISCHKGMLEIKAQKTEKNEEKQGKKTYMVRESASSFYRRMTLPEHADTDNIEAHFDNGILRVVIPYKELPAPKKVEIKKSK